MTRVKAKYQKNNKNKKVGMYAPYHLKPTVEGGGQPQDTLLHLDCTFAQTPDELTINDVIAQGEGIFVKSNLINLEWNMTNLTP